MFFCYTFSSFIFTSLFSPSSSTSSCSISSLFSSFFFFFSSSFPHPPYVSTTSPYFHLVFSFSSPLNLFLLCHQQLRLLHWSFLLFSSSCSYFIPSSFPVLTLINFFFLSSCFLPYSPFWPTQLGPQSLKWPTSNLVIPRYIHRHTSGLGRSR